MRKGKGDGQQEEYAFRRLLGAVLLEAVLDALSEKGVRWQDRTSALAFLRDANVQALCEAHLVLPPDLWRVFAEAAGWDAEIDYVVVEGLGDSLAAASLTQESKALNGQSKALSGQTKTLAGQTEASATRRASSPRKRRPAGESHSQAGAPPEEIVVTERTVTPEPTAQPASPGGLIGLMRRVQQAVGWPAAAGAG
jgi:hypothetical protein